MYLLIQIVCAFGMLALYHHHHVGEDVSYWKGIFPVALILIIFSVSSYLEGRKSVKKG